jgi:hypothetical protein
MKKVVLMLFIGLWGSSLLAQDIPDCDYNPYRHKEWRESAFREYRSLSKMYSEYECYEDSWQKIRDEFHKTQDVQLLEAIYYYQSCPEMVDFLKYIIDSSNNETARCKAIEVLSNRFQNSEIPFFKNHLKREISINEQLAVALALFKLRETTLSMEIFDRYCYEMEEMGSKCFFNYQFTEDEQAAVRYFNFFFDKPQTKMEAAVELARLGVVDKTFPYFVELLKDNDLVSSTHALVGLAAIGSRAAFDIIKQETNNKDNLISQAAKRILNTIIEKRREKCEK